MINSIRYHHLKKKRSAEKEISKDLTTINNYYVNKPTKSRKN